VGQLDGKEPGVGETTDNKDGDICGGNNWVLEREGEFGSSRMGKSDEGGDNAWLSEGWAGDDVARNDGILLEPHMTGIL